MTTRNDLRFHDGRFRILQISDLQENPHVSPDTIALERALIADAAPDLIVLTGDQLKGYGFEYLASRDKKAAVRRTLRQLLAPIEESGVPFTAVFGNHDNAGEADTAFQWSVFETYPNFIGRSDPAAEGVGNDCLRVYDEKGENALFCVYLFDSHGTHGGACPPLAASQIDFYRRCRDELQAQAGHPVPALAFQHIPPYEIYALLQHTDKQIPGSLPGTGKHRGYYSLPAPQKDDRRSFMGETPSCPDAPSGMIEAFLEKGDVLGLFFGHDHNNSFVLNDRGVDLGYTQSSGFNVYGPGGSRGARVFDLSASDPAAYATFTRTYDDLLGHRPLERPAITAVYNHAPSSPAQVIGAIRRAMPAAAGVGTALFAARAFVKMTKKR